jgi:hypothetical protein
VWSYKIEKGSLKYRVIICDKGKERLKGTNLMKYIEWGEKQRYQKRPTCASRGTEHWYSLGKGWHYAPLIFPAKVGERMPVFVNDNVFEDKKLYGITPKGSLETAILAALLNSTLSRFFIEFTCRQLTGSQAIADIDVVVVESLPIFDINTIPEKIKQELINAFANLAKTDAESIFREIASSSEDVSLDKVKAERRAIDKIVLGKLLGLTDEEQLEVYRAVVDLVKSRLEKAKSFGKKKKTKEGIDVDALVKTVMNKIGSETIGKFYREKILPTKPLLTKTLPKLSGRLKIEESLFGWRLFSGKRHIECSSEEEARYLKIFLEAGLDKVKIPKEEDNLNDMLPQIETLRSRIDKIVNSYLESIVDKKTKEVIGHRLWAEIHK